MATLARAEQGSCPASSLRHRGQGRGRTDQNTSVCPNSHNGQTGLGQTSACSSSITNRMGAEPPHKGNRNVQNSVPGSTQGTRGSSSLQCYRCQGWGHMARECATPAAQLNREGGPKGMQSNPLQQSAVNTKHSLCDPKPKPTQEKAVKQKGWKGITPIPFFNPDPVANLVGCANEVSVVIDGREVTALVDSGAQVSNISVQLCEELDLKIQPLGQLLELEGTGGAAIPYLRFVEVNLQILGIRSYNKDVLLLAIPTMAYAERVPVMVGSKIIDRALSCMTSGELAHVTATW